MPVRVVFEADNPDELIQLVSRWVQSAGGPGEAGGTPVTSSRVYRALVQGVRGEGSRRLLHEVAEASAQGEAVAFDAALVERYGRTKPVALAGITSGANRRMRRLTGRLLIERDQDGYRMAHDDATGVLAAFAAEEARTEPYEH